MVIVNGHEYKTIADPIYINGKRVSQIWVNRVQVYPTGKERVKPESVMMYFGFSSDIISKYSSTPVNRYGVYAKFSKDVPGGIYRAAFVIQTGGEYPQRQLIVSFEDYEQYDGVITYVPYVSKNDTIVADGFSSSDIHTFVLEENVLDGKYYYKTNLIGVNLQDADGNYLVDYTTNTKTVNVAIYGSTSEAESYILS